MNTLIYMHNTNIGIDILNQQADTIIKSHKVYESTKLKLKKTKQTIKYSTAVTH